MPNIDTPYARSTSSIDADHLGFISSAYGSAVADDEIDTVEADERELRRPRDAPDPPPNSTPCRSGSDRRPAPARCRNTVSRRATRLVTDQLIRETERHGAPVRGDEHDRGRDAVDTLLRVVADRDSHTGKPSPYALSSSGTERLHDPIGGFARDVHARDRRCEPLPAKTSGEQKRIADAAQHIRRISPERAALSDVERGDAPRRAGDSRSSKDRRPRRTRCHVPHAPPRTR